MNRHEPGHAPLTSVAVATLPDFKRLLHSYGAKNREQAESHKPEADGSLEAKHIMQLKDPVHDQPRPAGKEKYQLQQFLHLTTPKSITAMSTDVCDLPTPANFMRSSQHPAFTRVRLETVGRHLRPRTQKRGVNDGGILIS